MCVCVLKRKKKTKCKFDSTYIYRESYQIEVKPFDNLAIFKNLIVE